MGQPEPPVFYYAPDKSYLTIMLVGRKDRAVRLSKSSDLQKWDHIFDIPNKAAECIDMYTRPVHGNPKNMKWIIANAPTRYEIGDFDGKSWKGLGDKDKNNRALQFDFGDSYYAAQVFNEGPGGRVVHLGWLRTTQA